MKVERWYSREWSCGTVGISARVLHCDDDDESLSEIITPTLGTQIQGTIRGKVVREEEKRTTFFAPVNTSITSNCRRTGRDVKRLRNNWNPNQRFRGAFNHNAFIRNERNLKWAPSTLRLFNSVSVHKTTPRLKRHRRRYRLTTQARRQRVNKLSMTTT